MLTAREVAGHNSRQSCWVIISSQVYDVTDFLDDHPGGAKSILRYGGKDATVEYDLIHPLGTIEKGLGSGPIDLATVQPSTGARQRENSSSKTVPISVCVSLDDLEAVARQKLSKRAWIYYDSAADTLSTQARNRDDWSRIMFRPRILRNVARVSMKRKFLGHENDHPFFVAPAAMAKLGHPDGELCLTKGAARTNITHCASTYSSVTHDDLADCLREERKRGSLAFQLYLPKVKRDGVKLVAMARRLGFKALVITVDTAVVGKREEDERYKAELEWEENGGVEIPRTNDPDPTLETPILRGYHSSTLDWQDLSWIRSEWGPNTGPVYLKGIQSAEDAKRALDAGLDGIYLSNHGGRQLDYAPTAVHTLLAIRKFCPEVFAKMEVLVDGGVRRGTDIVKALCLGATAVGIGRPFMYALSAYGTDGVVKAVQILSEEVDTTMRLLGVTSLGQLSRKYINTVSLERDFESAMDEDEPSPQSKL